MNIPLTAAALALALAAVTPAQAQTQDKAKGKVLVVMSSAHQLLLKDGKSYTTGYFLNELAIPLQMIINAGFTPVFANPKGDTPAMDPNSNSKNFFGGDDAKRGQAEAFVQSFDALKHPKTLASVVSEGTKEYAGVFVPGGHAPMEDLLKDKSLGTILRSFHDTARPTGIICHGPVALLSTLDDPAGYQKALIDGKASEAAKLAKGWPYAGYKMTVFSTVEEKQVEGKVQLGGDVLFYPEAALEKAGAITINAPAWQSHVVEDRELVTGQQPSSDQELGKALVAKLLAKSS